MLAGKDQCSASWHDTSVLSRAWHLQDSMVTPLQNSFFAGEQHFGANSGAAYASST
jgi:hypothetical protein